MSLIHFMRSRKVIWAFIVLGLTLFLSTNVYAAEFNQAELKTSLKEPYEISRSITENESLAPITFRLIEDSGEFASPVWLYTDGLLTETETASIASELFNMTRDEDYDATESFMLEENDRVEISVTVDTTGAKPGLYKGAITIHAENATDLIIPLKIEISIPIYMAAIWNGVGVGIGIVLVFLGVIIPQRGKGLSIAKLVRNALFPASKQEIARIVIAVLLIIVFWAMAMVAFYPKMVAFGANGLIDFLTAFVFGFTQVGASKISSDVLKK